MNGVAEYMHLLFSRVNVWHVTHGSIAIDVNGKYLNDPASAIRDAWRLLSPAQQSQFGNKPEAWQANAEAVRERGWRCYEVNPLGESHHVDLEIKIGPWSGAPLETITTKLNEMAKQGWVVINVGEDKGLYAGADAHDESFPSRIRYLLQRSVQTSDTASM